MRQVDRSIRVSANDKKKGMTTDELMGILITAPGDGVPTVEIGLNGRIKAISYSLRVKEQ